MRICSVFATLLALVFGAYYAAAPSAAAEEASLAPATQRWRCEFGFRLTAPGAPPRAIGATFGMSVAPDGAVTGQGVETSETEQAPFEFHGRWSSDGALIVIDGEKTGGFTGAGAGEGAAAPSQEAKPFLFHSAPQGHYAMSYTRSLPNGRLYASQCRRAI